MTYRDQWISHGTTFFGSEGWVSVDRAGLYTSDPKLKQIKLKPNDTHLYNSPGHERNFVDCMKTRAQTISPIEAAIRSDTISHMADICVRLGRPIEWDPKKEAIVNDEQATRMLSRSSRKYFS